MSDSSGRRLENITVSSRLISPSCNFMDDYIIFVEQQNTLSFLKKQLQVSKVIRFVVPNAFQLYFIGFSYFNRPATAFAVHVPGLLSIL